MAGKMDKQAKYALEQRGKGRKRVRFPVDADLLDAADRYFAPLYPGRLQYIRFGAIAQLAALRLKEGRLDPACFMAAAMGGLSEDVKPIGGWRSMWVLDAYKDAAINCGASAVIGLAGYAKDGAVVEGFLVAAYLADLAQKGRTNVPTDDAALFVKIMKDHEHLKDMLLVKKNTVRKVPGRVSIKTARDHVAQKQLIKQAKQSTPVGQQLFLPVAS